MYLEVLRGEYPKTVLEAFDRDLLNGAYPPSSPSESSKEKQRYLKSLNTISKFLPFPFRRPKRFFSEEEVDALMLGIAKFGQGNWTAILKSFPFANRTAVDLKDKW